MLYWINQVLFRALQVLVHWGRQLNNHTIQLNNKQSLVEKDTKYSFVDVHLAASRSSFKNLFLSF